MISSIYNKGVICKFFKRISYYNSIKCNMRGGFDEIWN